VAYRSTALAILAFVKAKTSGHDRAALTWLAEQRDPAGTFPIRRSNVLGLKALSPAPASHWRRPARRISVTWGETFQAGDRYPADQGELMQQLDLTPHLQPASSGDTDRFDRHSTGTR